MPGFLNLKEKSNTWETKQFEKKKKNNFFQFSILSRLYTKNDLCWCDFISIPAMKGEEIMSKSKYFNQINIFSKIYTITLTNVNIQYFS